MTTKKETTRYICECGSVLKLKYRVDWFIARHKETQKHKKRIHKETKKYICECGSVLKLKYAVDWFIARHKETQKHKKFLNTE